MATVAFPFSVFSSSMDRLSPVTSHDLISSCTRQEGDAKRQVNQPRSIMDFWMNYRSPKGLQSSKTLNKRAKNLHEGICGNLCAAAAATKQFTRRYTMHGDSGIA